MTAKWLILALNGGYGLAGITLLIGWLRGLRRNYRDIALSEVAADVHEGEELLRDVLNEPQGT